MNDAELVQNVSNGNENAFRFLVTKHQRLVMYVVGRVVQQQADVEDICQEVFMKVFRKIDRFRGDSKLSTWIATIAYNTSISYVRKQSRHREPSYDEDPLLMTLEREQVYSHKTVEKDEAKKYLLQLIEKLPVNYWTVLTLYYLEEFS